MTSTIRGDVSSKKAAMQGSIAQTIGLVIAANARLRGFTMPSWPNASIFQFCNSVSFCGLKRRWFGRQNTVYPDASRWLDAVATLGEASLRVFRRNDPNVSERNGIGFANGGPIFAIQISDMCWWGDWAVTQESAVDNRIWSVVYRPFLSPDVPPSSAAPADIRNELQSAIEGAIAFAREYRLGFDDLLAGALGTLEKDDPFADFYHADIAPVGMLDLSARQIIGCCSKAWVFGGMGSWNDVGFENATDTARYEAVSDRLFWALIDGLVCATNSTAM